MGITNDFLLCTTKLAYLERLKLANPERDASSMRGVITFSAMSDSTVNVGSTMKSIKPEVGENQIHDPDSSYWREE